jgi:hypothetical protein
MKANEIRSLIEVLTEEQRKSEEWLDTINQEVCSVFFDNFLVNSLYKRCDICMKLALGDLYNDVYWFLNDWAPGYSITINSNEYVINNLGDYMNYLITEKLVTM